MTVFVTNGEDKGFICPICSAPNYVLSVNNTSVIDCWNCVSANPVAGSAEGDRVDGLPYGKLF